MTNQDSKITDTSKINDNKIEKEFVFNWRKFATSCNEIYMEEDHVCCCLDESLDEYFYPHPGEYYHDYDGLYTNYWEDDLNPFYDKREDWLENIKFHIKQSYITDRNLIFDDKLFVEYLNQNNFDTKDNNHSLYTIFYRKIMNSALLCIPAKEYNKEIAYKCGLIPFYYVYKYYYCHYCVQQTYYYCKGKYLLMLEKSKDGNIDLSPKLDAYQALTSGTIDPNSKLFKDRAYFEQVVGVDLTQEVLAAISQS